jgi:hypothetical protein
MPYIPAPEKLPGFPNARRTEPKSQRRRWIDADAGRIIEWDYRHGAVEVYDKQGHHLGEYDPDTGIRQKDPVPGRRIEP